MNANVAEGFGVLEHTLGQIKGRYGSIKTWAAKSAGVQAAKGVASTTLNDIGMRSVNAAGEMAWNPISAGLVYGAGGAVGAGYSYATDDGHMGRDIGLGVLGVGVFRGGRSLYKNKELSAAYTGLKNDVSSTVAGWRNDASEIRSYNDWLRRNSMHSARG